MTSSITLADIELARHRIADGIESTPCPHSIPLSQLAGCEVYCKLDLFQRTGSFKERGARNALLLLSDESKRRGVIAASAGNHAQALAYHGGLLGVPTTVVMPRFAPLIKQMNCRRFGARVILHGDSFSEAKAHAEQIRERDGLVYIHGFDDPAIIAGQGTMGLEILEQVPDVEAIVVPIGGGGLLAGVSIAVKSLRPQVQVIGIEPAASASFSASLRAGEPTQVPLLATVADGLAVARVGNNAFAAARSRVDRVVTVAEEHLAISVVRLMELEKIVAEGAGAAALAGLLSGQLPELRGRKVVLLLCGGNIDLTIVERLIEMALVADGRLARFTAVISDRPGGLAKAAQIIGDSGASIKDVDHDRAFAGPNVATVHVLFTIETRNAEHIEQVFTALRAANIPVFPQGRCSAL